MTASILQYTLREGLFYKEGNGISCSLPGSAITVRFTGKSVCVFLKDLSGAGKNWMNAWIDDLPPRVFRVDPEKETDEYQIADDLDCGEHILILQKRTEAAFGSLLIEDISTPDGLLLPPPAAPRHWLLLIGDSITCGFGNEAQIPHDTDASRENFALTYGCMAARQLGMGVLSCSASGSGVYQNFGGGKEGRMSDYFMDHFCRDLDERAIDPFRPAAALINLGTNDWSAPVTDAQFEGKYRELLRFFRHRYPQVPLICSIGPMNFNPSPVLCGLTRKLRQNGDSHIYFLEFPEIRRSVDGFGGDGHPSVRKHASMAQILVQKLVEIYPELRKTNNVQTF